MKTTFRLLLLFIWIPASLASNLTTPLSHISNAVDAKSSEQITLLEQLVNINSGTNNIPGVKRVGELLIKEFNQLGFKTSWHEQPASMKRAGTLIAQRLGKKGKRVLLIGHLDTVFPINSPFQSFERLGHFAKGPGVIDDKGGDVVIVYALKALDSIKALEDANITVVLTGDEEDSGKPSSISRKALLDAARQSDIALDFEGGINQGTAAIARRGILMWQLQTDGLGGHSSLIFKPGFGDGAVFELARILNTLRLELMNEQDLSFNVGLILGGTSLHFDEDKSMGKAFGKENVIPKLALATGDIRFLSLEQKVKAIDKIKTIVQHHLAKTKAKIFFQDGIPAMSPTSKNLQLLKKYSTVSETYGYGPVKASRPGIRGAGDISYVAKEVSASLVGLGPLGQGTHSVQETVDLDSLPMQTKRAAGLIYKLISNEETKITWR